DLSLVHPRGGRESPVAGHEHADADSLRGGAVDALHLLVANGEGLGLLANHPSVGVVGAGGPGRLHRLSHDVQHPGWTSGPKSTGCAEPAAQPTPRHRRRHAWVATLLA